MAGRSILVCFLVSAAAFLVLYASGSQVDAVTFKITYGTTLSCAGPDGSYTGGTGDDSCVEDGTYGAYGVGLSADMLSNFAIPAATPRHANFTKVVTFGIPSAWTIKRGPDLPLGAYIGPLTSQTTLSVANSACPTSPTLQVVIPLYNCSTDNSAGNQITWTGDGSNLTVDTDGDGLPEGCNQYPAHVDTVMEGLTPRARLYGFTIAIGGATPPPPTQINFVMMNTEQLTQNPEPEGDMVDALGYANFVILDNPIAPPAAAAGGWPCPPRTVFPAVSCRITVIDAYFKLQSS